MLKVGQNPELWCFRATIAHNTPFYNEDRVLCCHFPFNCLYAKTAELIMPTSVRLLIDLMPNDTNAAVLRHVRACMVHTSSRSRF
jgi:hypothetical protein